MKSRTIVVPKDKDAQNALNYNEATEEQLIEVSLHEEEFISLLNAGFFESINRVAAVNIDDYEDECIVEHQKLVAVSNSKLFTGNLSEKVKQIKALFDEAIKRDTGVYFYF